MIQIKKAVPPDIRRVPGFPSYEIDSNGNIYSFRRSSTPRRLRPGLTRLGYLTVALEGKTFPIHKLMQRAFLTCSPRLVVNHIDGVKQHNYLENLEEVTSSQNNLHAHQTGLWRRRK
ncbi:MAG: HNH endonuclease [Sulfuricella sp.]